MQGEEQACRWTEVDHSVWPLDSEPSPLVFFFPSRARRWGSHSPGCLLDCPSPSINHESYRLPEFVIPYFHFPIPVRAERRCLGGMGAWKLLSVTCMVSKHPQVTMARQEPLTQLGSWKATEVVGEMFLVCLGLKQQCFVKPNLLLS